jgi:uncharacterized protein YceK
MPIMNAKIVAVCVVAAGALNLAGCGTIANICLENEQTGKVPMHVYGGLEADFRFMEEDDPSSHGKPSVDPFKVVYLTTDLPLSFVADTVTLPLTLPMAYLEKGSQTSYPFPKATPGGPTPQPATASAPAPQSPAAQEPANNAGGNPDAWTPPGFKPIQP